MAPPPSYEQFVDDGSSDHDDDEWKAYYTSGIQDDGRPVVDVKNRFVCGTATRFRERSRVLSDASVSPVGDSDDVFELVSTCDAADSVNVLDNYMIAHECKIVEGRDFGIELSMRRVAKE